MNNIKTFCKHIKKQLATEQLLTDPSECLSYSYDNGRHRGQAQAVVLAESIDNIKQTLRLCHQLKIPVIARGRGTGTPGGAVPILGGIVLSLERMQTIHQVDHDNRLLIADAGTTNQAVQQAAKKLGLFWPPDPSSSAYCTIGGNLAYNSAGPRAVKYGSCRENTLGLHAILANGDSLKTGVYTTKGAVGYDLTRLLIGSEGTLAIIHQAILKLTPLPEKTLCCQAFYTDITGAADAVKALMCQPETPSALEFIDHQALNLIRQQDSNLMIPEKANAMLMIEFDGNTNTIQLLTNLLDSKLSNLSLLHFKLADNNHERQQLWHVRKALSPTLKHVAPYKINEDIVVPVSTIPELIQYLDTLAQQFKITIVNFGHAGNGNIHVNLLVHPNDNAEMQRAEQCLKALFNKVLELNGTLSGEHGVGIEKRDYIQYAIEPTALDLMRNIKQLFDPNNILNPGKIFPTS